MDTREQNARKRERRAKRRQQFAQLKLQADILCDSHQDEGRQTVIIGRMMNIILDIIGRRNLNDQSRQVLANHFEDCAFRAEGAVQLGGEGDKDAIFLDGAFRIDELARRLVWSDARSYQTLEAKDYA